ncbi:MAG: SPFH domain-containing protein [Planctomycetota bacterium]|jgi:regulator of protease activity HflC (stomatin/prohibitin superfamily)
MDFSQFLMKAGKIFPRFAVVFPNEGGVFLRMGKYKKTLGPGLYFCFPIIDEVLKLDITTQVINLPNQSMTTRDAKAIAISGAIEYSIYDPRKALLDVQNFDASLQNLSMGIIGVFIKERTYQDCIKVNGLEGKVIEGIKDRAEEWGLKVKRFWITDMARHRVYRLMTHDSPQVVLPEEKSDFD